MARTEDLTDAQKVRVIIVVAASYTVYSGLDKSLLAWKQEGIDRRMN